MIRRTSSVLERVIQERPSFNDILARASLLDLSLLDPGHGDTSSAEAIANYFLHKKQDAIDAHLLELQRLQRIGLRNMMSLLWLSSHCTWKASLLCGSIYKSILDAKLSIACVQTILEAPSPYSQVGDLLIALADLQILFSGHTLKGIQEAQDLFSELDSKLKKHLHRVRVRALSRISAVKRRAHHGVSHYRLAMRAFKACLMSRFNMCNTGMSGGSSSNKEETLTRRMRRNGDDEEPLTHGLSPDGDDDDDDDDDDFDVDIDDGAAAKHSGLHVAYSGFTGFTPLHKTHVRLHKLETCMHAINIMFDTLKSLVKGMQSQTLSERYIESLRNEPLMFEGVAELITGCHASLSKHLDDLREQVLISFCFINNARALVYFM